VKVLREWVDELPRREQGALVVALRGCDDAPKRPYDSPERQLVAYLRYVVMNPADEREVDIEGGFMQSQPPASWKASDFGHYPQHWYAHLMHAFEVVGFRHPDGETAFTAIKIYLAFVNNLHLRPEQIGDFENRMLEDRIATGTVVS